MACSLSYDAAGNVISDGSLSYVYDLENRMTKFVSSTTDIYVYDGDGQRVKKNTGTVTLYWFGATGNVLDETGSTGTLVSEYIYFNGKRVARRDADNSVKYYFSDSLGSASVITNSVGAMPPLAESDYYPYGGEIPITTGDSNHYKFTGKERDSESGLDNFEARYFTSALGRFMAPNWAARPTTVPYATFGDPQTLNLYTYVENAPLNRIDADGHQLQGPYQPGESNLEGELRYEELYIERTNGAQTNNETQSQAQNHGSEPEHKLSAANWTITDSFGGGHDTWVNPTGGQVRGCDGGGCGNFGAPRNEGLGATPGGTDYVATPGQNVVAVHEGTVTGIGYAYQGDTRLQIMNIKTPGGMTVGELYTAPSANVKVGTRVSTGETIGTAQDIRIRTGPKVTPHIHVQIRDSGGQRINPETLIPTP